MKYVVVVVEPGGNQTIDSVYAEWEEYRIAISLFFTFKSIINETNNYCIYFPFIC